MPAWLVRVRVLALGPSLPGSSRCLPSLKGKAVPGPAEGRSPGLAGRGIAVAVSEVWSRGLGMTLASGCLLS